ncbi:MAG: phytanoyl-CoA dioxygenase family protein [Bacteroidetes bacterium]|nr:MAG: phytanoyl-CoA dioxygenase family protein [Bacteroidota bacterium]
MMVSVEAIESYRSQGYYLHREPLFTPVRLDALQAIFEEHLAGRGAKRSDELDTPHFEDSRLLDFLLDPQVLDLVEAFIGPNIGLFSSHFICKEPRVGRRTPWHEDSAYWAGKFDRLDQLVTIWLALDDTDQENGCMGVIPGTHRNGFSAYAEVADSQDSTFGTEIAAGSFDENQAVWFELKRGQCSLHDARIIHGAPANRSDRRRCGYTMRYFALDMRFNPAAAPGHRLWHARGENLAGNDFIVR